MTVELLSKSNLPQSDNKDWEKNYLLVKNMEGVKTSRKSKTSV